MFQRDRMEMFVLLLICVQYSIAAPVQDAIKRPHGRVPRMQGCYYKAAHFENGERILTNEPCLNCTCIESTLMCFLRVCPFVKPVGEECEEIKDKDECCPKIHCPEADKERDCDDPNHDHSKYDTPGCFLNGKYYSDGAMLPHDPTKPCEVCYCIRNMTSCVIQECELKVDGCSPVFKPGQCCPCRYNCSYEETTTIPPGFTVQDLSEGCMLPDGRFVEDGEAVNSTNPCEHCYCMRNEMVCAITECQAPGDYCKPLRPKPGQCCPDKYECPSKGENLKSSAPSFSTVFGAEGSTPHTPVRKNYGTKSSSIKGIGIKGASYIPSHFKPITFKGTDETVKSTETSLPTASLQDSTSQTIKDKTIDERGTVDKPQADNINEKSTSSSTPLIVERSTTETEEVKDITSGAHVSSTTKSEQIIDDAEKFIDYTTDSISYSTASKDYFPLESTIKEVTYPAPEEKIVTETYSDPEKHKSDLNISHNVQINASILPETKQHRIKGASPTPADIEDSFKDNIGIKEHPEVNLSKTSEPTIPENKDVDKGTSTQNAELSTDEFIRQYPFNTLGTDSIRFSNENSSQVSTSTSENHDQGSHIFKLPVSILRITGPKKNIVIPGVTGINTRPQVPFSIKSNQQGNSNAEFAEHTPTNIRVGIKGSQSGSHSLKGGQHVYPSRFRPILPVGAIPGESNQSIPPRKRPIVVMSIPGEGTCRQGKKVYQNGQFTESTGVCKINCQCINSVIYCDDIQCPFPPIADRSHCIKIRKSNECCPQYECRIASNLTKETPIQIEETTSFPDTTMSKITSKAPEVHTYFPEFPVKIPTTTTEEENDTSVPPSISSEKAYEAENVTPSPQSAQSIETHSEGSMPDEETSPIAPLDSNFSTESSTTGFTDILKSSITVDPSLQEDLSSIENKFKVTDKPSLKTTSSSHSETESSLDSETSTVDTESFSIQTDIPISKIDKIDLTTSTAADTSDETKYHETEDAKTTISQELPEEKINISEAEDTSTKGVTPTSVKPIYFSEKDVIYLESMTPGPEATHTEKKELFETEKNLAIYSTAIASDEPSSTILTSTIELSTIETTTPSQTDILSSLSTASYIDTSNSDITENPISLAEGIFTTEKPIETSPEKLTTTEKYLSTVESTYSELDAVTENHSEGIFTTEKTIETSPEILTTTEKYLSTVESTYSELDAVTENHHSNFTMPHPVTTGIIAEIPFSEKEEDSLKPFISTLLSSESTPTVSDKASEHSEISHNTSSETNDEIEISGLLTTLQNSSISSETSSEEIKSVQDEKYSDTTLSSETTTISLDKITKLPSSEDTYFTYDNISPSTDHELSDYETTTKYSQVTNIPFETTTSVPSEITDLDESTKLMSPPSLKPDFADTASTHKEDHIHVEFTFPHVSTQSAVADTSVFPESVELSTANEKSTFIITSTDLPAITFEEKNPPSSPSKIFPEPTAENFIENTEYTGSSEISTIKKGESVSTEETTAIFNETLFVTPSTISDNENTAIHSSEATFDGTTVSTVGETEKISENENINIDVRTTSSPTVTEYSPTENTSKLPSTITSSTEATTHKTHEDSETISSTVALIDVSEAGADSDTDGSNFETPRITDEPPNLIYNKTSDYSHLVLLENKIAEQNSSVKTSIPSVIFEQTTKVPDDKSKIEVATTESVTEAIDKIEIKEKISTSPKDSLEIFNVESVEDKVVDHTASELDEKSQTSTTFSTPQSVTTQANENIIIDRTVVTDFTVTSAPDKTKLTEFEDQDKLSEVNEATEIPEVDETTKYYEFGEVNQSTETSSFNPYSKHSEEITEPSLIPSSVPTEITNFDSNNSFNFNKEAKYPTTGESTTLGKLPTIFEQTFESSKEISSDSVMSSPVSLEATVGENKTIFIDSSVSEVVPTRISHIPYDAEAITISKSDNSSIPIFSTMEETTTEVSTKLLTAQFADDDKLHFPPPTITSEVEISEETSEVFPEITKSSHMPESLNTISADTVTVTENNRSVFDGETVILEVENFSTELSEFSKLGEPSATFIETDATPVSTSENYDQSSQTTEKSSSYFVGVSSQDNNFDSISSEVPTSIPTEEISSETGEKSTTFAQTITPSEPTVTIASTETESKTSVISNNEMPSNSEEPVHTLLVTDFISKLNSSSEEIGVTKATMASIAAETTSMPISTKLPFTTTLTSKIPDVTTVLKTTDLSQKISHTLEESAAKIISSITEIQTDEETLPTDSQPGTETSSEIEYVEFAGTADTPEVTAYAGTEQDLHLTGESVTEKPTTTISNTNTIELTTINEDLTNYTTTDTETGDLGFANKVFETVSFKPNDQNVHEPLFNISSDTSDMNLEDDNVTSAVQLDQHPSTESNTFPRDTEDLFTWIETLPDTDSSKMHRLSTEKRSTTEFDRVSTSNEKSLASTTAESTVKITLHNIPTEPTDSFTSLYTTTIDTRDSLSTAADKKIMHIPEAIIRTTATKATTIYHDEDISIPTESFTLDSRIKSTEISSDSSTSFPETTLIDIDTKDASESQFFDGHEESTVSTLKETEYALSTGGTEEIYSSSPIKESLKTEIPFEFEIRTVTDHPTTKKMLPQDIFTSINYDIDVNSTHPTSSTHDNSENSISSTLNNVKTTEKDEGLSSSTADVPNNYISGKGEASSSEQDITYTVVPSEIPEIPKTTLISQHPDTTKFISKDITSTDSTANYQYSSTNKLRDEHDSNTDISALTAEIAQEFLSNFTTEKSKDQVSQTTFSPNIFNESSIAKFSFTNDTHASDLSSKIPESVQTTLGSTSLIITESPADSTIIADLDRRTLSEEVATNLKNEGMNTAPLEIDSSNHPPLTLEGISEFYETNLIGNDKLEDGADYIKKETNANTSFNNEITPVNILNSTAYEPDSMIVSLNNASSVSISNDFKTESFSTLSFTTPVSPTDTKILDDVHFTALPEGTVKKESIFHPIIPEPENLIFHPKTSFEESTEITLRSTYPTTSKENDFTLKVDESISSDFTSRDNHFSTESDEEYSSSIFSSQTTESQISDKKNKLPYKESVTLVDHEKEYFDITNRSSDDVSLLSTTISHSTNEIIDKGVDSSNERESTIFSTLDSGLTSAIQTTSEAYNTKIADGITLNTVFPLAVSENQETNSYFVELVNDTDNITTDFTLMPSTAFDADSTRDMEHSSTQISKISKETIDKNDSNVSVLILDDSQPLATISKVTEDKKDIVEKEAVSTIAEYTQTVASSIPEYISNTNKPNNFIELEYSSVSSQLNTESTTSVDDSMEQRTRPSSLKENYLIFASENTKYDSEESTTLKQNTDLALTTSKQNYDPLQVTSQSNLLFNQSDVNDDHFDKIDGPNDEVKYTLEDKDMKKPSTQEIFSDFATQISVHIPPKLHTLNTTMHPEKHQTTTYDEKTFDANDETLFTDYEIIFNTEQPEFPIKKLITLNKTKESVSNILGIENGSIKPTNTSGIISGQTSDTFDTTSKFSHQQGVSSTTDSDEAAKTEQTKAPTESLVLTSTAQFTKHKDGSTVDEESMKRITVDNIIPEFSTTSTKPLSEDTFESSYTVIELQTTVNLSLQKTSVKGTESDVKESMSNVESVNFDEILEESLASQDSGKETSPAEISHTEFDNEDTTYSSIRTEFPTSNTAEWSEDAKFSSIVYPSSVQGEQFINSEKIDTILSKDVTDFEDKSTNVEGYTHENIDTSIEHDVRYTTKSDEETSQSTLKIQSSVESAENNTISESLKVPESDILVPSKNILEISPMEIVSATEVTEKVPEIELKSVTPTFTKKEFNLSVTVTTAAFDYGTDRLSTEEKLENSSIYEHIIITEIKDTTYQSEMSTKSSELYTDLDIEGIEPTSQQVENDDVIAAEELESNKERESTSYSQTADSMTTSKLPYNISDKITLSEVTSTYPETSSNSKSHESTDFPTTSNIVDLDNLATSSYDPKLNSKPEESIEFVKTNEEYTAEEHTYQSTMSSQVEDEITETSKPTEITTYKPSDMTYMYVTTTPNYISHPTPEKHTITSIESEVISEMLGITTLLPKESTSYELPENVSSTLQISELTEQNIQSGYSNKDVFDVSIEIHNSTGMNDEIESPTSDTITDSDKLTYFTDRITLQGTDITSIPQYEGLGEVSSNDSVAFDKSSTDGYSPSNTYTSTKTEDESSTNNIYTTEKPTESVDVQSTIYEKISTISTIEFISNLTAEIESDLESVSEEPITRNKLLTTFPTTTERPMPDVTTINLNKLFGSMQTTTTTTEKDVTEITHRPPFIDTLLGFSESVSINNKTIHADKTDLKLQDLPEFTELNKQYPIIANKSGIKSKYPGPSSPAPTWVSYTVHEDIMKLISTKFPSSLPTTVYAIHTTDKPGGTQVGENGDVCYFDGEVYFTSEQIPQKDNCEFCFCFKGDVICLQQTCPPPIAGCYAIPIEGFCCPRFHCPVQQLWLNVSSLTTTTTLSPSGKVNTKIISQSGCEIGGQKYRLGQIVRPASNACIVCRCDYGGIMKCDPRACKPKESMIQQIVEEYTKKK